jgi:hypothetical protein
MGPQFLFAWQLVCTGTCTSLQLAGGRNYCFVYISVVSNDGKDVSDKILTVEILDFEALCPPNYTSWKLLAYF